MRLGQKLNTFYLHLQNNYWHRQNRQGCDLPWETVTFKVPRPFENMINVRSNDQFIKFYLHFRRNCCDWIVQSADFREEKQDVNVKVVIFFFSFLWLFWDKVAKPFCVYFLVYKAWMTYLGPINITCAFSFIPCALVINSNVGINQVYGILLHHHNTYGCHTRHDSDLPQKVPIHKVAWPFHQVVLRNHVTN